MKKKASNTQNQHRIQRLSNEDRDKVPQSQAEKMSNRVAQYNLPKSKVFDAQLSRLGKLPQNSSRPRQEARSVSNPPLPQPSTSESTTASATEIEIQNIREGSTQNSTANVGGILHELAQKHFIAGRSFAKVGSLVYQDGEPIGPGFESNAQAAALGDRVSVTYKAVTIGGTTKLADSSFQESSCVLGEGSLIKGASPINVLVSRERITS